MYCYFTKLILFLVGSFTVITSHAAPALTMSQEVYDLHAVVLYICCGIGLSVFIMLIYSLIKFHKSKTGNVEHFHKKLSHEIFWASLPFIILIALTLPMMNAFFGFVIISLPS